MQRYRAALILCIVGGILMTAAFITGLNILGGPGDLGAILALIAFISITVPLWVLGLISFLAAFLLSSGRKSRVLGLSFGYAAILNLSFSYLTLTDSGVIRALKFEAKTMIIGLPIIAALLLGIAAVKRF